jgi:hypothetical protein
MSTTDLTAPGKRAGVSFMVVSAALSALAVSSLLGYMTYRQIRRLHAWYFLKKELDDSADAADSSYLVNLMVAELLQAIGGLLNLKWVAEGQVTEGFHCTAQGILKQMGNLGIALTSLLIAIHTFRILVLEVHIPRWVPRAAISMIWFIVLLIIVIPSATYEPPYYGNTGLWCWINTRKYPYAGLGLEYAWMWLAAFLMLILYLLIALSIWGIIGRRRQWTTFKNSALARRWRSIAVSMLFYPAVYIICIFPISVVRWLRFRDTVEVSDSVTIGAAIVFASSGLLNVILYLTTRPNLIRKSRNNSTSSGSSSSQAESGFRSTTSDIKSLYTHGGPATARPFVSQPSPSYNGSGGWTPRHGSGMAQTYHYPGDPAQVVLLHKSSMTTVYSSSLASPPVTEVPLSPLPPPVPPK